MTLSKTERSASKFEAQMNLARLGGQCVWHAAECPPESLLCPPDAGWMCQAPILALGTGLLSIHRDGLPRRRGQGSGTGVRPGTPHFHPRHRHCLSREGGHGVTRPSLTSQREQVPKCEYPLREEGQGLPCVGQETDLRDQKAVGNSTQRKTYTPKRRAAPSGGDDFLTLRARGRCVRRDATDGRWQLALVIFPSFQPGRPSGWSVTTGTARAWTFVKLFLLNALSHVGT